MKNTNAITTLFVDIGGVLLTNGWDRLARGRAAAHFQLDVAEMQERHHLTFDTYEEGKLTLAEYLERVVFYTERAFTPEQFREFMFAQSQPFPEMLDLIERVKARHGLRVVVVSNEGRELNTYRIRKFGLNSFVDAFISSSYVHLRKPDVDMFHLALDIANASAQQVLYIENTAMFVQVAQGLGIRSILHTDTESTRAQLAAFGLALDGAEE
ncbi:MAG: HAD family phosphatase [Caldilineaceae bacterium]